MTCQPFSSGSDSSGYFTPPAEPPETYNTSSRPISRQEIISDRFIKLATPNQLEENFTVLDNDSDKDFEEIEPQEELNQKNMLQLENSFDESRSEESRYDDDEDNKSEKSMTLEEKAFDEVVLPRDDSFNFDEVDFTEPYNPEKSIWSKSEIKLNESPEISRKTITSAPSEHLKAIEYKPLDETPLKPPKTALPGSIDYEHNRDESPTKYPTRKLKTPMTRKLSCRTPRVDVKTTDILRPFSKPKDGYMEIMNHLGSLEWESTMKGLQGLNRLIKFHPEIVDSNMHAICVALGKHIRNLRSQVARSACYIAIELFKNPKKSLEMVCIDIN